MNPKRKAPAHLVVQRIAENLVHFRQVMQLTQAELATTAGVTVETIARLERCVRHRASANTNPSIETLVVIAEALYIPLTSLIGEPKAERTAAVAEQRAWRLREAKRLEAEAKRLRGKS